MEKKDGDSGKESRKKRHVLEKIETANLSLGVNKGEGAALASEVDKGRGSLQVLRQAQSGGAGGEQGDRKEVHLCFLVSWLALEWMEWTELKEADPPAL